MFKIFIYIHGSFLVTGILLLLYYAKIGHKIDEKLFDRSDKIRTPMPVKIFALALMVWLLVIIGFGIYQFLGH